LVTVGPRRIQLHEILINTAGGAFGDPATRQALLASPTCIITEAERSQAMEPSPRWRATGKPTSLYTTPFPRHN
jgi:hypothetical protein